MNQVMQLLREVLPVLGSGAGNGFKTWDEFTEFQGNQKVEN